MTLADLTDDWCQRADMDEQVWSLIVMTTCCKTYLRPLPCFDPGKDTGVFLVVNRRSRQLSDYGVTANELSALSGKVLAKHS